MNDQVPEPTTLESPPPPEALKNTPEVRIPIRTPEVRIPIRTPEVRIPIRTPEVNTPLRTPQHDPRRKKPQRFQENWQASLFACCEDMGLCVTTLLCPCVAAGLLFEFTDTTSFLGGCLASLIPCIGCFFLCLARNKVRELHQIKGTFGKDMLASYMLCMCTLIQSAYEVDTKPGQIMNRF